MATTAVVVGGGAASAGSRLFGVGPPPHMSTNQSGSRRIARGYYANLALTCRAAGLSSDPHRGAGVWGGCGSRALSRLGKTGRDAMSQTSMYPRPTNHVARLRRICNGSRPPCVIQSQKSKEWKWDTNVGHTQFRTALTAAQSERFTATRSTIVLLSKGITSIISTKAL